MSKKLPKKINYWARLNMCILELLSAFWVFPGLNIMQPVTSRVWTSYLACNLAVASVVCLFFFFFRFYDFHFWPKLFSGIRKVDLDLSITCTGDVPWRLLTIFFLSEFNSWNWKISKEGSLAVLYMGKQMFKQMFIHCWHQ